MQPVVFSAEDKILDMCCGTGGATRAILEKAGPASQIVGLDLSTGQIRAAQKHPKLRNVRFVEGDAACAPFRNGVFDKVFITHALHEMPRETRYRALSEARRVLRDGGAMIALELDEPEHLAVRWFVGFWFFYWLPFNFETPTRRDMLKHGLMKEVEEAGFQCVTKASKRGGVFQTVQGVKQTPNGGDALAAALSRRE
jgi:ubiquinone/menaquinone biosynthesis C-methylase UbiE